MAKQTIQNLSLEDKTVVVRVDFNVPLKFEGDTATITDDTRIQAALPTIKHLVENGAKVVLLSHLGRPKGERKPECSLRPAADRLGELLTASVYFCNDCIGDEADAAIGRLDTGEVLVMENVRYYAEEPANDPAFAAKLGKHADIFINDAFGTAHRAHASTAGIASHVDTTAIGFLMEKELEYLIGKLESPEKPFLVIIGGKKVSDKIGVITALMEKADAFIIGGAMAYAFLKAQGHPIGKSFCKDEDVPIAQGILDKVKGTNIRFLLPANTLEADDFSNDANANQTKPYADGGGVTDGWEGLDIGDLAITDFCNEIKGAKTVVWNGPMGVFEIDKFAEGTKAVANALAESDATVIVGGGDSVTAAKKFGVADQMAFISTGGGASLELLEGKELPGVAAIDDLA